MLRIKYNYVKFFKASHCLHKFFMRISKKIFLLVVPIINIWKKNNNIEQISWQRCACQCRVYDLISPAHLQCLHFTFVEKKIFPQIGRICKKQGKTRYFSLFNNIYELSKIICKREYCRYRYLPSQIHNHRILRITIITI